ncbi:ABC transporter ATP-binding protein [Caldicellulosiruptor acetigenus]|uniref:ABC transporter ATP-binding protein n=1 Tax=Caldicellulosiruptor acetigenus TaxID=301953 RepID=UPI00040C5127|nr:ABC transporter ATP-binding protein [Caldicellulosiruptor acetigenus]WAM36667.1 ABC transporter ATP-binding protein [Caldicellulosiruptor acetigenus]
MIELYDIYKIYKMGENEVYALNGVNLKINAHEFVAIVGPSGSGKSTLMNIIGCLDTPTSGTYILDGHEVSRLNDNQLAEIRNSKIGFVFQNFNLIPQLTALENVELPLIYKGVPASVRHRLAKEALARVGLEHRMHHRPRELSGGQQQRVAIARALVTSPPIILADEPTGNLDSKSGAEIMQIFKELHAQGNTIVLITHDNNIAMQAKRIVRIQDGQIIEDKEVS